MKNIEEIKQEARDAKTKQAFIEFLQDPKTKDLRFWQALSAFSHRFIFFGTMQPVTGEVTDLEDTFYIEADKLLEGKSNV